MEPNWIGGGIVLVVLIAINVFCIRDLAGAAKWERDNPPTDLKQLHKAREMLGLFIDPAQVDELAPLMIDYAVKTRRQLPDVAMFFGKAILGHPRVLRRAGIDSEPGATSNENYARLLIWLAPVAGLAGAIGYGKPSPLEEALSALSDEFERPLRWVARKVSRSGMRQGVDDGD